MFKLKLTLSFLIQLICLTSELNLKKRPKLFCDNGVKFIEKDWNGNNKDYTCNITFYQSFNYDLDLFNESCSQIKPLTHACMNVDIKYDEQVPLSGQHRPVWPAYGEYNYIPPQRWIHSLEHGAAVFLYDPCANLNEIESFKQIARSCLRRHIISAYKKLPNKELFNVATLGCKLALTTVSSYEMEIKDFLRRNALKRNKRYMENVAKDGRYNFGLLKLAQIVTDFDDSIICP